MLDVSMRGILYQSRIFVKIFRASRTQLWSSNVSCQWVFMYLKCKSRSLWGSSNSQVRRSGSFWQYKEMSDTHRTRNIQEVFQIIPFLFLKQHDDTSDYEQRKRNPKKNGTIRKEYLPWDWEQYKEALAFSGPSEVVWEDQATSLAKTQNFLGCSSQ